jgi:hypothetical protein
VWDTVGTIHTVDTHDEVLTGREYWSNQIRSYDNSPVDKSSFELDLRRLRSTAVAVQYRHYPDYGRRWLDEAAKKFDQRPGKNVHTVLRIKGQWFGMMEAYSMIPEPQTYDLMIRSRLDIRFREPVFASPQLGSSQHSGLIVVGESEYDLDSPSPDANAHIQRVRERLADLPPVGRSLLVPCRDNGYVDDWFAVGPAETMGVHMTTFSRLDAYLEAMSAWPEPFESESIVALNALKHGIQLCLFPKTIYQ